MTGHHSPNLASVSGIEPLGGEVELHLGFSRTEQNAVSCLEWVGRSVAWHGALQWHPQSKEDEKCCAFLLYGLSKILCSTWQCIWLGGHTKHLFQTSNVVRHMNVLLPHNNSRSVKCWAICGGITLCWHRSFSCLCMEAFSTSAVMRRWEKTVEGSDEKVSNFLIDWRIQHI